MWSASFRVKSSMAAVRGFSLEKIKAVRIVFSTFDSRVSSAREFLRRVSSTKLHKTNPKCQIVTKILENRTDPSVEITFSDDSKASFNCIEMSPLKMVEEINKKARSL